MSAEPTVHRRPMPVEHSHPGPREYVKIAIILAVVTAIEVAVYYVEALQGVLIPVLLGLALVKFVMVAGYFMHLKFDSRLFRRFFVLGIVLAISIYTIVLVTFFVVVRA